MSRLRCLHNLWRNECLKRLIIFHADFYGGRQPPRTRWKATTRITSGGSGNRKVIPRGGLVWPAIGGADAGSEDFDRAAEGGQNAHRLSVEWSRIQPTPDTWDEEALERYRNMLRGLRERGITPMVTLHHYTDPLWLSEQGGWETEAVVSLFQRYVRKTVEALKEYCTLWCTLNEPNGYALNGYVKHNVAMFPPGKDNPRLAFRVMAMMIRAHAAAYHAIHEVQPEARVGYALHYRSFVALPSLVAFGSTIGQNCFQQFE